MADQFSAPRGDVRPIHCSISIDFLANLFQKNNLMKFCSLASLRQMLIFWQKHRIIFDSMSFFTFASDTFKCIIAVCDLLVYVMFM